MERRRHRSGGPRPDITAEPLDLSGLGSTRAARAIKFIETYLVVTSGKWARRPFKAQAVAEEDHQLRRPSRTAL
jgi:hypothetical protein